MDKPFEQTSTRQPFFRLVQIEVGLWMTYPPKIKQIQLGESSLLIKKNNKKKQIEYLKLLCLSCFHTRQIVYPDNYPSFRVKQPMSSTTLHKRTTHYNYPYLLPELIKGLTSDKKLLINFSKDDFGKVNGGH